MFHVLVTAALSIASQPMNSAHQEIIDAWLFSSASEETRRQAVRRLLDDEPGLARSTRDGQPLLAYALSLVDTEGELGRRGAELAELLVEKGADVDATDSDGDPLLIASARFGRRQSMTFLLTHGAKVDARDTQGRTALHWVALLKEDHDGENPERTETILNAAALLLDRKATLDARDARGWTPLASTAFLGNLELTKFLLSRGADINAADEDGYSVLGVCKLRVEETPTKPSFANEEEKAATRAVIRYLEEQGAKDMLPR
jgi:ankyrin repeat protein